jgi:ribosome-associated protein
MRLNKMQKVAVNALEEIKGQDILVLDVRKLTTMCDTMIIASAQSTRQVKALADNVRERLEQAGATIVGVEGEESAEWVLVDSGDIVIHVMQPAIRAYYKLEELWTPPPAARKRAAADTAAARKASSKDGDALAA